MKTFLTDSVVVLFLRMAGILVNLAIFVAIANKLSTTDVGAFSLISTVAVIARYLGPLGFDQVAIKIIPRYILDNDTASIQNLHASSLAFIIFSSAIVSALSVFLYSHATEQFFHLGLYFIFIGVVTSCAISGLCAGILRGHGRVFSAFLPDSFLSYLITAICCVYLVYTEELTLERSLVSAALGYACAALLQLASLAKISLKLPFPREYRAPFRDAFSMWTVQAANLLQSRSAVYFAYVLGTATTAALMDTAARVALLPTLVTWAIGSIAAPQLVKYSAQNKRGEVQKLILVSTWASFIPSVLTLVVYFAFGRLALSTFFPQEYLLSYWPTLICLGAMTINASTSICSTYLIYSGKQAVVFAFTVISAATFFISGFIISIYDVLIGISLSTLLSVAVRDFGIMLYLAQTEKLYSGVWDPRGISLLATLLKERSQQWLP
ncbi:hypothetical protein JNB71_13165 [Rhizobium herbae]|uniref:Polysaccharide biosynthesis protein C-terminal domain-containing protein n=1 Tax=Rhizobium herbae TaxID=508661 RepID=A0ABS7HAY0_9HYPH|nr:hypothetical protein [Rhizobium herbae]MBW9064270.1 hypothetical protein [Rhizobium herbae]